MKHHSYTINIKSYKIKYINLLLLHLVHLLVVKEMHVPPDKHELLKIHTAPYTLPLPPPPSPPPLHYTPPHRLYHRAGNQTISK